MCTTQMAEILLNNVNQQPKTKFKKLFKLNSARLMSHINSHSLGRQHERERLQQKSRKNKVTKPEASSQRKGKKGKRKAQGQHVSNSDSAGASFAGNQNPRVTKRRKSNGQAQESEAGANQRGRVGSRGYASHSGVSARSSTATAAATASESGEGNAQDQTFFEPVAMRMMEKMGYTAGQGLGRHRQGAKTPILAVQRPGRMGLGVDEKKKGKKKK
jgi:hypothetical protein